MIGLKEKQDARRYQMERSMTRKIDQKQDDNRPKAQAIKKG